MFFLLAAGILAFPAIAKHRVEGMLCGSILAYLLSIVRSTALYYILRINAANWESLHGLILPLAPILLMAWYCLRWSAVDISFQRNAGDAHLACSASALSETSQPFVPRTHLWSPQVLNGWPWIP